VIHQLLAFARALKVPPEALLPRYRMLRTDSCGQARGINELPWWLSSLVGRNTPVTNVPLSRLGFIPTASSSRGESVGDRDQSAARSAYPNRLGNRREDLPPSCLPPMREIYRLVSSPMNHRPYRSSACKKPREDHFRYWRFPPTQASDISYVDPLVCRSKNHGSAQGLPNELSV
jgi:hypothetical protein